MASFNAEPGSVLRLKSESSKPCRISIYCGEYGVVSMNLISDGSEISIIIGTQALVVTINDCDEDV